MYKLVHSHHFRICERDRGYQTRRLAASHWPPSTTNTVPLIKLAASEQIKTAAFSMSAIRPKRPSGILFLQPLFDRLGNEPLHAFSVFDWTRRDRVDAYAVTAPLNREIARECIDSCFRRGHVKLHRRAEIMKRRADVQNLPAMFLELRKRGAANVERAFQIDIDDSSESIWRQLFRGAKKVSGSAVDDDIDLAEVLDGLCNRLLDLFRLRTSAATAMPCRRCC